MADSNLWRDFAAQFEALSRPHADVRGTWQHVVSSGVSGDWRLDGDAPLRIRFEALARRAATELPIKRSTDLLIAWLEALREDGRDFRFWDSFPTGYVIGNIDRLCEASANFCRKLESLALQGEFEEKQRAQTTPEAKPPEIISRQAFVTPLLEAKGWSILDWATEAEVSHATAIDYLQGKRTPYRSTRLKLAKALNVSVDQLPK